MADSHLGAVDNYSPDGVNLTESVNRVYRRARMLVAIKGETVMLIGDRLRIIREDKKLSQGDVEKRTGLLRCYISRVENGHTVPAIETLEKLARAFEVPLYQIFYDGEEPPKLPNPPNRKTSAEMAWGSFGKDARFLNRLRSFLARVADEDRKLLLSMAQKMAVSKRRNHSAAAPA